MDKPRTFADILAREENANAQRLMLRARTANRIAKTARTAGARLGAYRVKNKTLLTLQERFPDRVIVNSDPQYGSYFVLVKIPDSRFGLHAPSRHFERRAA